MKKLIIALILLMSMAGCAEMSQFMKDQPLVSQIIVKDSVVAAIGLSTEDEAKRQEYAEKMVKVADGAIEALESGVAVTKEDVLAILDRELAKQDMEFFMKMIVQDVILVLNQIYPVDVPTVVIPEEHKEDIKNIFEYMKKGASIFIK